MLSEYPPDAWLPLSGIQHFIFCRRQWALIHVEQQWQESALTADGRIMHRAWTIPSSPKSERM